MKALRLNSLSVAFLNLRFPRTGVGCASASVTSLRMNLSHPEPNLALMRNCLDPGIAFRRARWSKRISLSIALSLVAACATSLHAQDTAPPSPSSSPKVQSPQPLQQLPREDPGKVSPVNTNDNCSITYTTIIDGYSVTIRLQLCSIHYHFPPEHGKGSPGEWGVPDCPGANSNNYPSLPPWGQPPQPPLHGPHKPTKAPEPGDIIEIHYVYGYSIEFDPILNPRARPRTCEQLRSDALSAPLSSCAGPLIVLVVWARVTPGTQMPLPKDWNPFSPFGGSEYHGSTTGDGRPTIPAYWRVNGGCRQVGIDDLDLDGTNPGKLQGHPSRPLQPK